MERLIFWYNTINFCVNWTLSYLQNMLRRNGRYDRLQPVIPTVAIVSSATLVIPTVANNPSWRNGNGRLVICCTFPYLPNGLRSRQSIWHTSARHSDCGKQSILEEWKQKKRNGNKKRGLGTETWRDCNKNFVIYCTLHRQFLEIWFYNIIHKTATKYKNLANIVYIVTKK